MTIPVVLVMINAAARVYVHQIVSTATCFSVASCGVECKNMTLLRVMCIILDISGVNEQGNTLIALISHPVELWFTTLTPPREYY